MTRREYEEKLTALDNDHQAAAKYLRGTEKMLSKMKQELQRVKTQSAEYLEELETLRAKETVNGTKEVAPADWELERESMRRDIETAKAGLVESITPLEAKITNLQAELQSRELDLEYLRSSHRTAESNLGALQNKHETSQADLERLQRENKVLEDRARDAEKKVHLLLDQVESSVDNYRRHQVPGANGSMHRRGPSNTSINSTLHAPSHRRGESMGGDSIYSQSIAPSEAENGEPEHLDEPEGRNSMALDSLANELDQLRSHWETSTKNYRLSDKFDFEKTPTQENAPRGGLADWRKGLDTGDDDDLSRSASPSKQMLNSVQEEHSKSNNNNNNNNNHHHDAATIAATAAAANAHHG